jgi:hypothetical protein
MVIFDGGDSSHRQWKEAVNGGYGNGVFATTVDAYDGMVAVASTATAQLTTRTAITTATISHAVPSHEVRRLRRQAVMSTTGQLIRSARQPAILSSNAEGNRS